MQMSKRGAKHQQEHAQIFRAVQSVQRVAKDMIRETTVMRLEP